MMKSKQLIVMGLSLLSANAFSQVCTSQIVDSYGSVFKEFQSNGVDDKKACMEAMKACRLALRKIQRTGQLVGADCNKIGLVDNSNDIDNPPYDPNSNDSVNDTQDSYDAYDFELNQLQSVLNNGSWRAREIAAKQLKNYSSLRSLKMAIKVSVNDSDIDVKRAAENSVLILTNSVMHAFNPQKIVRKLTSLTNDSHWKIRYVTAKIMKQTQSAYALLVMMKLVSDSDQDVRRVAKSSVDQIMQSQDLKYVLSAHELEVSDLLKSSQIETQVAIIQMIAKAKNRGLLIEVVSQLYNSSWKVREAAAIAIGQVNLRRAIVDLVKSSNDSDSDVRRAVENSISSIKNNHSFVNLSLGLIAQLKDLYHNSQSWKLRLSVVKVLGATLNYSVKSTLFAALDDSDFDVRRAAENELNKF